MTHGRPDDGARWLLRALAAGGVTRLFGNPGSTELPLIDALPAVPALDYVLGLHEGVVMGMADGYSQASGRLGVVNVHVQPGLANAMSGILNAARARVPLLVTVGQQATELLPQAPFLGGELVAMAAPLAKGAWEVARPADLPAALERAVRVALTPPCGPVMLSLPLDVQAGPAPRSEAVLGGAPAPIPDAAMVDRAAAVIAAAERPVVIAGDGVAHAGATQELAALAERAGAPIFGEPFAARVPIATDHRLWRGPLPGFSAEIGAVLAGFDVVVAIGCPVFRLFGVSDGPALEAHHRLVHLDVDPAEVGRVHTPAAGLVGDVRDGLAGLLERLGPASDESAARAARAAGETADRRRRARAALVRASERERVTSAGLALAIAGAVARRDLIVDEALTAGRGLRSALGRRAPGTWLAHRGSALGWGLPAAVGAALADPGRRVLAVQGDGGALFGISALWTAARRGLGVACVIADNGGYEILRAGMEGLTGQPEGPWPGLALDAPRLDLIAIAEGFGASAARVSRPADLAGGLHDMWRGAASGQPAVLVVDVTGRTPAVGYPIGPPAG